MNRSPLSRFPALRALVPFVLGIVLNTRLPGYVPIAALALTGIAVAVTLSLCGGNPLRQYALRPWWVVPLFALSMSAGALSLEAFRPRPIDLEQINGQMTSALIEQIETYDFAMRLQVRLLDMGEHNASSQRVLLATQGCDYTLHEGDVIGFVANLSPITNLGNPDEFDRENHLWQQGILYSQHLPASHLSRLGHRPTLLSRSASMRRLLVTQVLNTSLSPSVQDLIIALLLGNSRQIDNSVRNRFSQAGIAHILALSGLHVGLITGLIWFLLFPLDYLRLKKLRLVLTLAVLVGFAILTGLSPSVVRATIMIGFTLIAIVLYRKSVALNAMCVAALLSLCIWPTAIYQAGFQLSYVTVAAIVGLQGRLPDIDRQHRLLHGFWSLVSTSLIAMAATIMLSAYYFCSISLLSILSNVLILPVMPLVMVLGVVFLFLASIGLEWGLLNQCIEKLYAYMDIVSQWVSLIPGAHISGVYVTGWSVVFFYVTMACLIAWGVSRRGRWLVGALASMLLLISQLAWLRWSAPTSGLMLLNDYRATPILWHENGQSYVWLPDDPTADRPLFEQTHRRLLAHMNVDSLQWVTDSIRGDLSMVRSPFASIQGERMLVAGKGMTRTWLEQIGEIGAIDILVITKRYHGRLDDIAAHCPCSLVVLSGDLPDDRRQAHLDACQRLHLPSHDLKQGAYIIEN